MNAAREKVRVADALGELPKISASFARREISYSKVRAMTRVATAEEEEKAVENRLRKRAAGEEYADPDVSGEFEDEHVPFDHRRADALTNMAESYLANGPAASSSADRYQVVLHVSAETLTNNDGDVSHIEDGPRVSAETARRICCDAGISVLSKDEDGTILNIGRKSRIIPPAMRRALKACAVH